MGTSRINSLPLRVLVILACMGPLTASAVEGEVAVGTVGGMFGYAIGGGAELSGRLTVLDPDWRGGFTLDAWSRVLLLPSSALFVKAHSQAAARFTWRWLSAGVAVGARYEFHEWTTEDRGFERTSVHVGPSVAVQLPRIRDLQLRFVASWLPLGPQPDTLHTWLQLEAAWRWLSLGLFGGTHEWVDPRYGHRPEYRGLIVPSVGASISGRLWF